MACDAFQRSKGQPMVRSDNFQVLKRLGYRRPALPAKPGEGTGAE
jgi:hypothetical protein